MKYVTQKEAAESGRASAARSIARLTARVRGLEYLLARAEALTRLAVTGETEIYCNRLAADLLGEEIRAALKAKGGAS